MQATADHLSLETCKLLKDCGVESSLWWHYYVSDNLYIAGTCWMDLDPLESDAAIPCYTWSDVLWKHADKFFGSSFVRLGRSILDEASLIVPCYILRCLKEGDYERADQMFKDKCILIPQSTNE